MKSTVVLALAVLATWVSGCRFDRTPLAGPARERDAAAVAAEAGSPNADASFGSDAAAPDASDRPDAAESDEDGGTVADASSDGAIDLDAETVPEQPVVPPMTGGLSCGGAFCAFGVDPEKPCCTTADDVSQRTARSIGRCGLDLGALPGSPYGTRCWERDQLGIVDDRCPGLPAADGVKAEPGCCSDDGSCGSINSDRKLGCRYQAGSSARACAAETPGSSCDPTGSFGIRYQVDAAWGGRSGGLIGLTDDGRGKIEVYVLLKLQSVDPQTRNFQSDGRVCGVVLPPFYSTTLCEAYQPIFPVEMWEADELRPLRLSGRYECAANGCVLSLQPLTYLLGFSMENPEAPWPGPAMLNQLRCPEGNGARCFPDHDGDGDPGVRVEIATEGNASGGTGCRGRYALRGAPLSSNIAVIFGGAPRTDRLELGVRTKLGGTMRLADDCDSARGNAVAEYVNSRAAGCRVARSGFGNGGGNQDCNNNQAQFIDQNLPVYDILAPGQTPDGDLDLADESASRGPEVHVVRLGNYADEISCESVRAAMY